jgi:hypothetical protein
MKTKKSKLSTLEAKIKKSKPVLKETGKRINFPWLRNKTACKAKAYMAYCVDRNKMKAKDFSKVRSFFDTCIAPRILKKFPSLYVDVKKYYTEHGRSMDENHFLDLLYARFANMYTKNLVKDSEHPINSGNAELRQYYLYYVEKFSK